MENLHIHTWESNLKLKLLINKFRVLNFNNYFSKADPTRIDEKYENDINQILKSLPIFSQLCDNISEKISDENLDIMLADMNSKLAGGIEFDESICLICFFNLPIRPIIGTTWTSCLPISGKFNISNSSDEDYIPLIIRVDTQKFVICNKLNNPKSKLADILLFPGKIRFTVINIDKKNFVVGIYESLKLDKVTSYLNDPDIYEQIIDKKSVIDSKYSIPSIIDYLTSFHTRKVQTGYFAPENNDLSQSFNEFGLNFKVKNLDDYTYYENLSHIPENIHIPMEEFKNAIKKPFYIRKCDLVEGTIIKPIPLDLESSSNFSNRTILVDIRCIDLNFMWSIEKRDNQELPEESCYFLSKTDKKYLNYASHSPGMLFVVKGYYSDNEINY